MIEVRISQAEFGRQTNETARGIYAVNRLRDAGIPVVGVLCVLGVESGALTMSQDDMFDEMVYTWAPNP